MKIPAGFAPALPVSALQPGESRQCRIGERRLALFRTAHGFHALDDRCPHQGSSLAGGHFDGVRVTCPSHGWRFEVCTGRAVSSIGTGARCYAVRIVDGMVCVKVHSLRDRLRAVWARWRAVRGKSR